MDDGKCFLYTYVENTNGARVGRLSPGQAHNCGEMFRVLKPILNDPLACSLIQFS